MSAQNPNHLDASAEALHASELRYRRLFESAKDGILILDAETGLIVDVNPFLIELLGISRKAFLDKKVWELGSLKNIAASEGKFAELCAQEQIRYEDLPLETAAGRPIAVEFVSNVYLVDGHRVIQCNIRDITERKRAEEEHRREKDELEQRVRRQTEELALRLSQLRALAEELRLAEKQARKRLAKVLHDHIQQLLVAAKIHVAMIGRNGDDSVRQAVWEAEGMIDECIAASRSLTAELSPHILHEAGLNAGLEWLAGWMNDKHGFSVNLDMEAIGHLPDISKIMLFESVRELLFNAVKHSHTRSARVSLRTADGLLRLVVSDSGGGFDPHVISPCDKSGNGFGLFSVRERLELIGGQFEMESAPGKGSRFVLSVPVTQPGAVRSGSKEPSVLPALQAENIAATTPRSSGRKMHLLQR
jgi:PAS domain S-box-containing protein